MKALALLVTLLVCLTSCRTISEETGEDLIAEEATEDLISEEATGDLRKPVDCSTAEQDIQMLESEKASIAKRFVDGPTTVIPAGAVLSILTLQEKDKLEVRIGEYNHRLTEKIREIKMTCGLESVVDMEASDETNGSHRDQFADREVQEGARSPVIPTEDLER